MSVLTTIGVLAALTLCFVVWWAVVHHMDENGKMQRTDKRADIVGYVGLLLLSVVALGAAYLLGPR